MSNISNALSDFHVFDTNISNNKQQFLELGKIRGITEFINVAGTAGTAGKAATDGISVIAGTTGNRHGNSHTGPPAKPNT